MASIAGGVVKAIKDWGGVGNRVYVGYVEESVELVFPYIVIWDLIGDSSVVRGDDSDVTRSRELQIDLWCRGDATAPEDVATLGDALRRILADGEIIADAKTYRLSLAGMNRVDDPSDRSARIVYMVHVPYEV